MDFREEALEILKNNNVSIANMAVWIAGYIAGREKSYEIALQEQIDIDFEEDI